jgi:predicted kinase
MIVQLAGLPGTGKSTLAAAIRGHLGPACLALDKDRVRQALYGAAHTEYSRSQDDFVTSLLHHAAIRHLAAREDATVILERTCTRTYQLTDAAALAGLTGHPLAVIECVCPDHVARDRLAAARRDRAHPAANRDFPLYQKLKAEAEPITVPALRLHTDTPIGQSAACALTYLAQVAAGTAPGTENRP